MSHKKRKYHLYAPRNKPEPVPQIPYFKLPAALSSFTPTPRIIQPRLSKAYARKHKLKPPRSRATSALNISEPVGWPNSCDTRFKQLGISPGSGSQSSRSWLSAGTNTRVGIRNPRWKDQTRLGANATTPLSGVIINDERTPWSGYSIGTQTLNGQIVRTWDYSGWGQPSYGVPNANVAPADVVTDVNNRCIRRFLNEVSEAQSSDNLTGRSIKHFKHDVHSTLHPMAGIREKINRYLTTLEKVPYGKLKGASLYSTITQAYLEFKFGVEPFVDDITAIVTDMCIKDRKRNPSVEVKSSAHRAYAGSSAPTAITGFTGDMVGFQLTYGRQITSDYSMRLKGAVRTGINDDGRLGLVQDNKLLPKDWLPTAFSIMPYAWMVNYFTNIRDIIDAASLRFSDLVWGCQTNLDRTIYSFSDVYFNLPNPFDNPSYKFNYASVCSGGHAVIEVRSVLRTAISPAGLIPSFVFSIPTSTTPWVNMMAAFSPRIFKLGSKLFS
jgi:hypothetical protein